MRVADDSTYRGACGSVVEPTALIMSALDGYRQRAVTEWRYVLVERVNGDLIVVPAHALERA